MEKLRRPVDRATREVRHAIRPARPWIIALARAGHIAKGIVYLVIGALAVQLATGNGGRGTDSHGALRTLVAQPFGRILLAAMATGLFGYAIWRIVQGVTDPEHNGSGPVAIARRIGRVGSGFIHAALAVTAIALVVGARAHHSDGEVQRRWTAQLLDHPLGHWLVGGIGAGVVAFGVAGIVRGVTAKFRDDWVLEGISPAVARWAVRSSQFGVAARGLVFMILGGFVIEAARRNDASEVRGFGGTLHWVHGAAWGPWLLGFIATGLLAYGIHMFIEARYARISSA